MTKRLHPQRVAIILQFVHILLIYRRISEKNKAYWSVVRKAWNDYLGKAARIELKTKVDGKRLHESLMALESDYAEKKISEADIYSKVSEQILKYIGRDSK